MNWWLPNDEAYPPIIRSIRRFVEERTSPAKNMPAEDLRDMKAIFASLKLDDSSISPTHDKMTSPNVAVAPSQESYIANDPMQEIGGMSMGQGDTYGFDDEVGFWGGPRPDDYM